MSAKTRYDVLSSDRSQFLNEAEQASKLTLPYLIRGHEEHTYGMKNLLTPYQSVGAKGVVTLASKLMLALLPVQTSFFKLQLDESQLGQEMGPEIKSELDLSFAKVERIILESIAATDDRVAVHQALRDEQTKRITDLQNVMQAQAQLRDRPTVAGIKTATGGPMQAMLSGASAAFGRRGMRIQSLNV